MSWDAFLSALAETGPYAVLLGLFSFLLYLFSSKQADNNAKLMEAALKELRLTFNDMTSRTDALYKDYMSRQDVLAQRKA
jgi:hypothetical protein